MISARKNNHFFPFHFPTSLFSEIPWCRLVNGPGVFHRFGVKKINFPLTNRDRCCIIPELSATHAAIAQSVERILGKDEVASSNLASSSNSS